MKNPPWWQTTTIYQIYPRSFKDSDGDGIGDLRGIISKLEYIQDLGFETIWVSPFFNSPQGDWGYDVSDYLSVAPEYGTLGDVDQLIEEVHARGMKILFDLVLNHTSVEHPWFQEARRSQNNPKRDWYIWRGGDGKRPPNNWKAMIGGSGWQYDDYTGQWYYASFLPFQPDLNYRNPAVKEAMLNVARHWLDRGVDGFRLDIFHTVYKDAQFRDNPPSPHYIPYKDQAGFFQEWRYHQHQPETFELARQLRALADSYSPEKMLIGEVFGPDAILKQYLGERNDGLNLVFLWELLKTKVDGRFFREVIQHHEQEYPAPLMPVYVFGNHDQKRIISKVAHQPRMARLLALLQFTTRGVPVTYYGEEIGMADVRIPAYKAKDPLGRLYRWLPAFLADALGLNVNRDGCRTPMQWDDSPNAGFCSARSTPWLPLHKKYREVNVAQQRGRATSILETYRALLCLRKEHKVLREGTLQLLGGPSGEKNLVIYRRVSGDEQIFVVINFGPVPVAFRNQTGCNQILFEIGLEQSGELKRTSMPPFSGVVLGTISPDSFSTPAIGD